MYLLTSLCLQNRIICPRKNQIWAVRLFKKFKKETKNANAKLVIVGARYSRQYEVDYINKIKEEIAGDSSIEIHDLTNDVDQYYRSSDCLLMTSLNEVTPLVISEAMSYRMPVISTNIAGVPEMMDGKITVFSY